ncbi:PucR family transcriptional regulator [Paenibacillus tarimensis]
MNIKDLMNTPIFSKSRIVAGKAGINRSVHSVNMMDAPDIIDFLKPQELLLTTAYAIKDHPCALKKLVLNMAEVGCAGLAIKTKRFLSEIPPNVLDAADELDFPIIELPLDYSLGEILNRSLSYILEKRTDELRYALETHRQLSKIVMKGKSFPEITEALSQLVGCPILLLDQKHQILAASPHFEDQHYESNIPGLQAVFRSLPESRAAISLCLLESLKIPHRNIVVYPIYTYQLQGYLVSFIDETPITNMPALAMEQAANVIGFEIMKKQAVKERSRRYKNEFFSDLVDGFVTSEQEVVNRGKSYGLTGLTASLCIVAKRDPFSGTAGFGSEFLDNRRFSEREDLYHLIKKELQASGLPYVIFTKNDSFVLLIAVDRDLMFIHETEKELTELLKKIIEKLYTDTGIPFSFGAGNPVKNLLDTAVSYKEALDALQAGYRLKKRMFVQFYRAKELTDLLRMVPIEELKQFYEGTFHDLTRTEAKERTDLIKTLWAFYENNCQIAETAKQLFIHRNTVTYRLEKCEQLTGRDLRDSGQSLRFRIAFLIEPMLK